jgi:hypothetical protein
MVTLRFEGHLIEKTILSIIVFGWPIFAAVVLIKNREELDSLRPRIERLYMGIHLTRNNQTILFYPIFILRRVLFVFAA